MMPVKTSLSSLPVKGLSFLDFAVAEGPIHFPGDALPCFGVFQFFLAAALADLSDAGRDFVLIDERADFAAGVLESVTQGGALIIEERDLLGDLVVLGFGGFFGGINFG